ncbi:MAG: FN3 associated domain-containing protein [Akkermansiaceae bacterium]
MRFPLINLTCLLLTGITSAKTDKYRVIWNSSPESSITIAWCQVDGEEPKVNYRIAGSKDSSKVQKADRETSYLELNSRFARLTGLQPDTSYEFIITDSNSTSETLKFKTAPTGEASFSFVAGGDSRNHRDARQRANRTVAKLRPLFVCFGGDMISKPTQKHWSQWLDDWQLTTGEDGHMIPIIAARGNHEGKKDIHAFFDTPIPDDYYAVDFGGGFLRVYTLNSNIVRAGSQGKWLAEDLAKHADAKWKIAHYHHPFRPHTAKKAEQNAQYTAWAPLFYKYGIDLAIECDSHVVKRTWPVRPSNEPGSEMGFIRDDTNGITFIGEGCWGAPLRRNDDNKKWTRASDSFNQVNWICVTPEKMFARSIKVDSVDSAETVDPANPFALPEGMEIWEPESGAVVTLLPRGKEGRPQLDPLSLIRLNIVGDKKFKEKTDVRIQLSDSLEMKGAEIRFTRDGSAPASDSEIYSAPFAVTETTTVSATVFRNGKALTAPTKQTFTSQK